MSETPTTASKPDRCPNCNRADCPYPAAVGNMKGKTGQEFTDAAIANGQAYEDCRAHTVDWREYALRLEKGASPALPTDAELRAWLEQERERINAICVGDATLDTREERARYLVLTNYGGVDALVLLIRDAIAATVGRRS